jgi:hypothetical protein
VLCQRRERRAIPLSIYDDGVDFSLGTVAAATSTVTGVWSIIDPRGFVILCPSQPPFTGGAAICPSDFVVVAATSSPATGKFGTARVFFGDFFTYIKLSQPLATLFFTGKIRRAHGEVVRRKICLILR